MKKYNLLAGLLLVLSLLFQACSDDDSLPLLEVRTSVISNITETGAQVDGKLVGVFDGITEVGITCSTEPAITETTVYTSVINASEEFSVSITGLRSGTLYFVRAYAKRGDELILGDLRSFTSAGQLSLQLPVQERFRGETFPPLYWTIIDKDGDGYNWESYSNRFFAALSDSYRSGDLTPENYLVSPKITLSGSKPLLSWSVGVMDDEYYMEHYKVVVSEEPFTEENCQTNGEVIFEESLPAEAYRTLLYRSVDLSKYQDKDIYVAWVHYNCSGLYCMYVTDIRVESENASLNISVPKLILNEPEEVDRTSADLEAEVTDDGGSSVIRKGFCYGTTSLPTIENSIGTVDPHQTFAMVLTDLTGGETYYVRAFAVNEAGIAYSEEIRFTTPEVIVTNLLEEALTSDIPSDWTILDKDGDGYCWEYYAGYGTVCSDSYLSATGALEPENYLFTPAVSIPGEATGAELSFDLAASAKNAFREKYRIVVSMQPVTLDNCRDADVILDYTELTQEYSQKNFVTQKVDLSAYVGKTIYIGFVHGDCSDMESLLLKNVIVNAYE